MRRFAIAVLAVIVLLPAAAQQQPPAQQPPAAPQITPDQLWGALMIGNKQYVAGKLTYEGLKEEREQFRNAQIAPITVLACSDSRVPPELIFNQSLGSMVVVRAAGNVADDFGVGSIELAVQRGWTRLIVVLAHENCDAVQAALGGGDPDTPSLQALAKRLRSSFLRAPYDSRDLKNVNRAAEDNARASAAHLLAASKVIRDAVLTEKVKVVPAYYSFNGEVKPLQ